MIRNAKYGTKVIVTATGTRSTVKTVSTKKGEKYILLENGMVCKPSELERDTGPNYALKKTGSTWTLFQENQGIFVTSKKKIADFVLEHIYEILEE